MLLLEVQAIKPVMMGKVKDFGRGKRGGEIDKITSRTKAV